MNHRRSTLICREKCIPRKGIKERDFKYVMPCVVSGFKSINNYIILNKHTSPMALTEHEMELPLNWL